MGSHIRRRDFLKYSGFAIAGAALPAWGHESDGDDDRLVQVVDEAQLYMTHYALFEEPDPNVPPALYFDAATGAPTSELSLAPPLLSRAFRRARRGELIAPPTASKLLPYVVEPPGFPPLPAPAPIVGFIQQVTGLPADLIASHTEVLLVAIGQFLGESPARARRRGHHFEIEEQVHFEVRIRTGFLFELPGAPPVGILTGYLDAGLLHQLIQLPPPPDPTQIIVYSWRAHMTLSTENQYVRPVAAEPPPVADAFPAGMTEIRFAGSPIDCHGRYTVVGSAAPAGVEFLAPPELELFLFGGPLSDVEFAVTQSGRLSDED
jgi:hypothetical protein